MKINIRKRNLFYFLAFSSAIISAVVAGFDSISQTFVTDPWALGLSCFILGVVIAVFFSLVFSIPYKDKPIGSIIDPSFKSIRLIRKKEIPHQLLAGAGNAFMTIGYFILLGIMEGDISVVLPFSQVVILYLVIIESITEKDTPTLVEVQSSVIVTFGAILGSIALTGTLKLEALAIVFLVINPGWVLLSVYQRKLKLLKFKDRPNDSINIRLWNVISSCGISALVILIYDIFSGSNHLVNGIYVSIDYGLLIGVIGIGSFFGFVFYIRALGIGKASVTQAVKASVIVFSIPISIALGYLGYIEPFTTDPIMILIKFIGVVLILLGIISFALTLTKAYIFIKVKPGFDLEKTMENLWNIRGVNRVCAVAGPYDFMIKIRTRTLVKGYERIIRKVEEVPGIKEYRWQSVLKEWEDL